MGEGEVEPGLVRVTLTRQEVVALREAIELTPNFRGRPAARDAVLVAVKARRPTATVTMPVESADGLARQLVPTEISLVMVRAKLRRAIVAAHAPPPAANLPAASSG